ncbi:MAG TPA: ParA family protein [Candidatus Saccharimonadales bacterium]|nr:ParA family protein [Candidatus Saccharimonadales bacterium]
MTAKVIAITNQKGGVGKTTTGINLAYNLAKRGKNVLLVDFDPQGNATSGLGFNKQSLAHTIGDVVTGKIQARQAILTTDYEHLALLPATPHLANTEVEMTSQENRFTRLRQALESLEYDLVLIDCPPALSLLTVNALVAARYLILPVQAEFYALEGLSQLLETVQLIRQGANQNLELLGVVMTMYDSRTTLSKQVFDEVTKHFPDKVFHTVIPRNIRLAEAPSHGVPVAVYDKWSKGARAYKQLAKEVAERVG